MAGAISEEPSIADALGEALFQMPAGRKLPAGLEGPLLAFRDSLVRALHDEVRCPFYTRAELAALLDRLVDWRDRNRAALVEGAALSPFPDSPWLAAAFSSIPLHPRLVSLRALGLADDDVARGERERLFDLGSAVCNLCCSALTTSAAGVVDRVVAVVADGFTRDEVHGYLAHAGVTLAPTTVLRFGDSSKGVPVVDLSTGIAAMLALALHVEDEIAEGSFHAVRSMWSATPLLANKTMPATYLEYVGTRLQGPLDAILAEVDRRFCVRERTLAEPDPVADHRGARWAAAEARLGAVLAGALLDEALVRVRVPPALRATVEAALAKSAAAIVAAHTPKPSPLPQAPPAMRRAAPKFWSVTFEGVDRQVRHSDGAAYVAVLLGRPGMPTPARQLRTAKDGHDDVGAATAAHDPTRTRDAIKTEIANLLAQRKQLAAKLKSASATARRKLDADIRRVDAEITSERKRAGGSDKAYGSVHKAIERFLASAEADHPDFGRHLRESIAFKDGGFIYRPKEAILWIVQTAPPADRRRRTTRVRG